MQTSMWWGIDVKKMSDAVVRFSVVGLIGALPFLVIPLPWVTVLQGKMIIVALVVLVGTLVWTIGRISDGVFSLPRNLIFFAAALLPITYAISAIAHGNTTSFIGGGVEQDTVVVVSLYYALLALSVFAFSNPFRGVISFLRAFLVGSALLVVFQLARLFFPDALSLGVLSGTASALVGSWHDFGIILGLLVFISYALFSSNVLEGSWKWLAVGVGVVSVLLLVVVNWSDVWYAVGAFALLSAALQWSVARSRREGMRDILKRAGVWGVLGIVGLLAGFGSSFIYEALPPSLQIVQAEVRPSWQGTFAVGEKVFEGGPALLFGSGPNTFSNVWGQFKPHDVNATVFWNTDFTTGVGTIPTSLVTVGSIGFIAWCILCLLVLWSAIRFLRSRDQASSMHVLSYAVLGSCIYLLAFQILYAPGVAVSALTFLFLGLLVLLQSAERASLMFRLSLQEWKGVLYLALLMILTAVFAYLSFTALRVAVSDTFVNMSMYSYSQSRDIARSLASVQIALRLYPANDRAERAAVELGLLQLQEMVARGDDSDQARIQLQAALSQTVQHGLAAVSINEKNYHNWFALAQLYQNLAGAGVEGASEGAHSALLKARETNPTNPLPLVSLAQLASAEGKNDEALGFLEEALALKPDLPSALFLRSQLKAGKGEMEVAVKDAEAVASLVPQDPLAWYNFGAISYAAGSYEIAVQALGQALLLQRDYANALFVQALAYEKLGNREAALVALGRVAELNPGDASIQELFTSYKAGEPLDSGLPQ